MRLRDASNETLKNNDPINESVINESATLSTAWAVVRRRVDAGPTRSALNRDHGDGVAVCKSAVARATAPSIAEPRLAPLESHVSRRA